MDLSGNNPKCECHQCTWLRANQVERAFAPKEPDGFQKQEKKEIEMSPMPCGCRWVNVLGCSNPVHNPKPDPQKCVGHHGVRCSCMANTYTQPKDPVEEKIRTIVNRFSGQLRDWQLDQLHELVELARKR